MKRLLQKLGVKTGNRTIEKKDLETVLGNEIDEKLSSLPYERLRYLAAFGGLLGNVANADGHISDEESNRIRAILKVFTKLSPDEAEMLERIINDQTKALVGLENHMYTREINEISDRDQKMEIISCLFAVAAADDEISPEENEVVRRISKALLLHHSDFVAIRSLYRDKLSVLKGLPGD